MEMSLNGHVAWLRLASRTRILAAALFSLLIVSFPAPGQCDEATDHAEPSADWEMDGTLYFWVSAVEGDVTADGVKSDLDLSFGDVIDQTDFSFMGALNLTYQRRWFIFLDLVVADISDDESTGTPLGPLRIDVESRQIRSELLVGRRVLSRPLSKLRGLPAREDDPRVLHLDLFGGLRYWYLKDEVELRLGPLLLDSTNTSRWVDLVVGARVRLDLTENLLLEMSANIGGFGLGSASDLTWQLFPVVTYLLTDHWSVSGGYRVTYVNREQGDDETDLLWHGPAVGATYRF